MPYEIIPGLWIGDFDDFVRLVEIEPRERSFTHVVSVVNGTLPGKETFSGDEDEEKCSFPIQNHIHIDIEDSEDENLLQHLPAVNAFITEALEYETNADACLLQGKKSACLVHCAQGSSRSAAVVVGYLMQSKNMNFDRSLEIVKRGAPAACPNIGFVRQLILFQEMEFTLDSSYIPYKKFLTEQAAIKFHKGTVDLQSFSLPDESLMCLESKTGETKSLYRCRKCRSLVATSQNVLEIVSGIGQEAFSWRKRDKQTGKSRVIDDENGSPQFGGIFVEPLKWMDGVAQGDIEGKLYCPSCKARLGSFNWSGIQSSTGTWVTPAFHLHAAKLDEEPIQTKNQTRNHDFLRIRKPRLLSSRRSAIQGTPSTGNNGAAPVQSLQNLKLDANSPGRSANLVFKHGHLPVPQKYREYMHSSDGRMLKFPFLIFDCDGVLVNSEEASCGALRLAILETIGLDIPHKFPDDFRPVFGMDVKSCIEYYYETNKEHNGWSDPKFNATNSDGDGQRKEHTPDINSIATEVSLRKEHIYRRLTSNGVNAFPGVSKLIENCYELGIKVAVASSGSPDKIHHNLETSGLLPCFPNQGLIVSAKHVARGKPSPDVYIEALKRLGCYDPSQAIVIEDAVNGLNAARDAGCWCIAVTTSLPSETLLPHAHIVYEDLQDIDIEQLHNYLIRFLD